MTYDWIWVWVALAIIMTVAEILSGGFFALPFAVGASAAALLQWLYPGSVEWQWAAFIGLSVVLLVALRRLVMRRQQTLERQDETATLT